MPTQADIDELDVWLNGIESGVQRFGGEAPGGKRIRPVAFTKRTLTLAPTIQVLRKYEGAALASARAAILAELRPLAVDDDGDYVWEPGQQITTDRVKAIFSASVKGYFATTFASFSGITLGALELPDVDAAGLNITILGVTT